MLILNQSNLRIAEFVQQKLGLSNDQVYTNIHKYGNTTVCSPIALYEAAAMGKIKKGDLVCVASYGSGITPGQCIVLLVVFFPDFCVTSCCTFMAPPVVSLTCAFRSIVNKKYKGCDATKSRLTLLQFVSK